MHPLFVVGKQIVLDRCEVLYDRPFTAETLATDWQVRGGDWWVEGEWLTGRNPHNCPGMVTSRASYCCNVLLDFEGRTVPPCTHDINCMWNGSWYEDRNERALAYVAGLEGWWEGKVGFEKSPEYNLIAATPLFDFEPGRSYRMQAGSIDGHAFVFVDGRLVLEVKDPDPIDATRYGMIGFEAYASMIQVRRLVVRRIAWSEHRLSYEPEF